MNRQLEHLPKNPLCQQDPCMKIWYSDVWMHEAIKTHQATDQCAHNPHQELTMYLSLTLEEADNIVAWWGVSNLIMTCLSAT
jgi:hypothetical protein